jgi:NADH dehydrogenase
MRIAITGATGFVGTHLTRRLESEGHDLVLISRRLVASGLSDVDALTQLFTGCKAIAHCAGIDREIGDQTYERVHVEGTRNVVEAAKRAGVERIVLLSFLRAGPDCGSPYHETKWAAEEIVRNSGLDYTVLKAGVIYGRGDHMLDHLSRALLAIVGLKEKSIRPLAIEDLVHVMRAALVDRRMKRQTLAVLGPEEIYLSEAIRRVAEVVGKRPLVLPLPVVRQRLMARFWEVEPGSPVIPLPYDLVPTRRFTIDQIRDGVLSHKKAQKAQNENRLKGEEKRVSESEKIILCLLCLFVALLWLS